MKEDGQSTQIYEPPETVVDHFDSSYQGYHLAFWQRGQRSWNRYSKERRDKWIQQTLAALKLFSLEVAVKKRVAHGRSIASEMD